MQRSSAEALINNTTQNTKTKKKNKVNCIFMFQTERGSDREAKVA